MPGVDVLVAMNMTPRNLPRRSRGPNPLGVVFANCCEFCGGRRVCEAEIFRDPQRPAGLLLDLLQRRTGMKRGENHFMGFRIEGENAHARDHAARASAFEPLARAPTGAITMAGRSDVMNAGKKTSSFLVHNDNAALRQR